MLAVDNSHNKIIWPHLASDDNRFWVLCYAEEGQHKVVIADADRVLQEPYVAEDKREDLLTVFTGTDAATLFIAALGQKVGGQLNEHFRVVSMSKQQLLAFITDLDKVYQSRQNAFLRVDVCELRHGELSREILFSRQIPKH